MHAVDNRCPHMGFPLHRGTVARRDPHVPLAPRALRPLHAAARSTSGPTSCAASRSRSTATTSTSTSRRADDPVEHQRKRLRDGLERDIPLVLAKAAIALVGGRPERRRRVPRGPRLRRRAPRRRLVPRPDDAHLLHEPRAAARRRRPRGGALPRSRRRRRRLGRMEPPRFPLDPLPGGERRAGAARALVPRLRRGARRRGRRARARLRGPRRAPRRRELADMLFAAATDHRYLDGGHTLDFVNKALEALDVAGWERAEAVLASLPAQLAGAERMEEANAWRNPVDLVALLEDAFERAARGARRGRRGGGWDGRADARRDGARRRAGGDPRGAARRAARGRDRGRARLGGLVRGRDADRALPDEQRVRRLGHRPAHVHVRERGRAGPAALAVARARCAACSTRR